LKLKSNINQELQKIKASLENIARCYGQTEVLPK
jgi:hypothetical protein